MTHDLRPQDIQESLAKRGGPGTLGTVGNAETVQNSEMTNPLSVQMKNQL